MSDDVKDLLGRAFGDEPPLRLDRQEVIEQGRKRLRRKRTFEAGGVVAAVVAAAVGVARLTGLTGAEPDRLPPAASSTYQAPPGPSLPVTTDIKLPPSPTMSTSTGQLSAMGLTSALFAAGVLAVKQVQPLPGRTGTPRFEPAGDRYVFEGDAYQSGRQGLVRIIVGYSVDVTVDGSECAAMVPRATDCSVREQTGPAVVVGHFQEPGGERRTTASVVMPDGLRVYAAATNRTASRADASAVPVGAQVVLSDDELCALVVKVGAGA
jgi:hypothetical protein